MTTLKQGDLIKNKDGNTYKVLGVCGDAVFISSSKNHEQYAFTATEVSLRQSGYSWDTPVWEPEIGDAYYYLSGCGDTVSGYWNNYDIQQDQRDFLGIYETEELAHSALLEIRRKLGK